MVNLLLAFSTKDLISDTTYYIICAALAIMVLIGIALMSKVKKAVLGNTISAIAIFLGIVVTLIKYDVLPVWILYPSMVVGIIIGLLLALRVKMIEMPQMVALLNGVGGAASAIVGIFAALGIGSKNDIFSIVTALIALAVGMITLVGSLVAAGKLHKVISQIPIILPNHALFTGASLVLTLLSIIVGAAGLVNPTLVILLTIVFSSLFGIVFTIRVGGADMPITISLLNSFSGVAGAIAGLAISDILLVAVGGIVGASGLLLTQIMCRAMNRSLLDILLGKTTLTKMASKPPVSKESDNNLSLEEGANIIETIKSAKNVIIVPGYGMALAQAQHLVKKLADELKTGGATVKFAIHPVAGRMPGHMNVLLAEADVDYDDLWEMEAINDEFKDSDLVIVIGANDVLNPAAREAEGTPIYGMPILNVDQSKNVIIFNYDTKPGYAGVENPLYHKAGVHLILGNASETLKDILNKL